MNVTIEKIEFPSQSKKSSAETVDEVKVTQGDGSIVLCSLKNSVLSHWKIVDWWFWLFAFVCFQSVVLLSEHPN